MSIKVSLVQSWRALVVAGLVASLAACKKLTSDEGLSPLSIDMLGIPQLNAASRINGEDKSPMVEAEVDLVPPEFGKD